MADPTKKNEPAASPENDTNVISNLRFDQMTSPPAAYHTMGDASPEGNASPVLYDSDGARSLAEEKTPAEPLLSPIVLHMRDIVARKDWDAADDAFIYTLAEDPDRQYLQEFIDALQGPDVPADKRMRIIAGIKKHQDPVTLNYSRVPEIIRPTCDVIGDSTQKFYAELEKNPAVKKSFDDCMEEYGPEGDACQPSGYSYCAEKVKNQTKR